MWQIRNLPIVDKSTRLGAKAEQSHHNNRRAAATSLEDVTPLILQPRSLAYFVRPSRASRP
jgi:hypothetical protein